MPAFPSGTRKFFKNTSAPTGWTKDSNTYNHALRVITTSTFGSGGTANFTEVFTANKSAGTITQPGAVNSLSVSASAMDIPAHTHTYSGSIGTPVNSPNSGYYFPAGPTSPPTITGWFGSPGFRTSGSAGVGTGHTHTISSTLEVAFGSSNPADLSVKYVDSIICIKD